MWTSSSRVRATYPSDPGTSLQDPQTTVAQHDLQTTVTQPSTPRPSKPEASATQVSLETIIARAIQQGLAQGLQQGLFQALPQATTSSSRSYHSQEDLSEKPQHSTARSERGSVSEEEEARDLDLSDDEGLAPGQLAFIGLSGLNFLDLCFLRLSRSPTLAVLFHLPRRLLQGLLTLPLRYSQSHLLSLN